MKTLVANLSFSVLVMSFVLVLGYFSHPLEIFYIPAAVALFASAMVVLGTNPVHSLLYLVLSLLAIATIFFALGAPFAGLLEVIVYAGAIMVLFVFVVMMLNLGHRTEDQERRWLSAPAWIGPGLLSGALLFLLGKALWPVQFITPAGTSEVTAKAVGMALYGPYLLVVELASMLLLGALVAAFHLGRSE